MNSLARADPQQSCVKSATSWARTGSAMRVASISMRICRRSVPQGTAATEAPVTARESACMKAHQTGTFADWLLRVEKDCDQPVSVGCGTLAWHCAERELSYWMVFRSTPMKGMPANITTTMATNTRFSMRHLPSRRRRHRAGPVPPAGPRGPPPPAPADAVQAPLQVCEQPLGLLAFAGRLLLVAAQVGTLGFERGADALVDR